jgi:hypothetical protein
MSEIRDLSQRDIDALWAVDGLLSGIQERVEDSWEAAECGIGELADAAKVIMEMLLEEARSSEGKKGDN